MSRLRQNWERTLAVASAALGGLAILAGWIGISGSVKTFQQVPYIVSGGFFGLFLLGVGATLWLSADQRETWRKLDSVERLARGTEFGLEPSNDGVTTPDDHPVVGAALPSGSSK